MSKPTTTQTEAQIGRLAIRKYEIEQQLSEAQRGAVDGRGGPVTGRHELQIAFTNADGELRAAVASHLSAEVAR